MKSCQPSARLFLVILCVFSIIPVVHAQKAKRLSFEISPLYSYMNVQLGKYSVRNNPGIEDPQPGLGGALKYEVDLSHRFTLSAGISYERRHHTYESMFYDTTSPTIYLDYIPPYKFTYDDSYDFIGLPVALQINYLNHSGFRIYQSFGTQFSFMVQSDRNSVWYYENKEAEAHHKEGTAGKTDVVVSLTSSIGVSKNITKRVALKLAPGISYMANNFYEESWAHMKYFDLRVDMGLVYNLNRSRD